MDQLWPGGRAHGTMIPQVHGPRHRMGMTTAGARRTDQPEAT